MKKFLYSLIILMTLLFSGCATGKLVSVPNNPNDQDIRIFQTNSGYVVFENKSSYGDKPYKTHIQIMDSIVLFAKTNNYKYFGFVNEEINNLNGFPVNTYFAFRKYMIPEGGYHKNGKGNQSYWGPSFMRYEVMYFKEKQQGLFLYNVEDFEKDRAIYEAEEEAKNPKLKAIRESMRVNNN